MGVVNLSFSRLYMSLNGYTNSVMSKPSPLVSADGSDWVFVNCTETVCDFIFSKMTKNVDVYTSPYGFVKRVAKTQSYENTNFSLSSFNLTVMRDGTEVNLPISYLYLTSGGSVSSAVAVNRALASLKPFFKAFNIDTLSGVLGGIDLYGDSVVVSS